MIRETTATGRDVNQAIDAGCEQLGISRDDAQFEIISLPKKGFLGLKTYPAKVRVYQELPDIKPTPRPAEKKPAPAKTAERAPAAKKAAEAKPGQKRPAAPAGEKKPVQEKRPAPEKKPVPQHQQEEQPKPAPVEVIPDEQVRIKVEKAVAYLTEIMQEMGFEGIQVSPRYYQENVCLHLGGAQLGLIIGRRGETLDALQYLTSLVANRGEGEYIRLNIDSGNYREKREKTLTALARKLALHAVRTGKSTTLEPMNPYERRVIHGAVSQIRGAVSSSVGADPNRRVVISCADPGKVRSERYGKGDRRDGKGSDPRKGGDRRPPRREGGFIPNTNTVESVKAASVTASVPAAATAPAQSKTGKLSDTELFAGIPMGVPIVPGEPGAKKLAPKKPEPKVPRKLDDDGSNGSAPLYGKIK